MFVDMCSVTLPCSNMSFPSNIQQIIISNRKRASLSIVLCLPSTQTIKRPPQKIQMRVCDMRMKNDCPTNQSKPRMFCISIRFYRICAELLHPFHDGVVCAFDIAAAASSGVRMRHERKSFSRAPPHCHPVAK